MKNIIAVIGSYRKNGVSDQVVAEILAGAEEAGANVRCVFLRDVDIQFCDNCRSCMQKPGDEPGKCVINDAMTELMEACINADGIVLASSINAGAVTATFKRFIERFSPLAYWPFGTPAPKMRKGIRQKSAILVISSAAPAFVWKLGGFTAEKTMRSTAKMLNAKPIRTLKYGMMSQKQHPTLSEAQRAKARNYGRQMASR